MRSASWLTSVLRGLVPSQPAGSATGAGIPPLRPG
jgi:hypothetical protein